MGDGCPQWEHNARCVLEFLLRGGPAHPVVEGSRGLYPKNRAVTVAGAATGSFSLSAALARRGVHLLSVSTRNLGKFKFK